MRRVDCSCERSLIGGLAKEVIPLRLEVLVYGLLFRACDLVRRVGLLTFFHLPSLSFYGLGLCN